MKKQYNGKKFRYGSSSAILTACLIVAVILLNVFVSALSNRFSWMYIDMTPEELYTITDDCFDLIREDVLPVIDGIRADNKEYNASNGASRGDAIGDISGDHAETEFVAADENIKIHIRFMSEKDILSENTTTNYVLQSALEIVNEFRDYMDVSYINTDKNPSAVQKYLTTSLSTIADTDVVVEFGTEFRVIPISRFYITDPSTEEVWAYDGEKQFASAILAVTRAESPICLIDMAHGEKFYDYQLLYTIEDAGFRLASTQDYLTDEVISEVEQEYNGDVRMILIYNPNSDFLVSAIDNNGNVLSQVDEIDTLDKFLDGKSSLMVFMSPTSPVLPNLEEYLEEWGISFDRHVSSSKTSSYMIKDASSSLTSDGHTVVSEYVKSGLGKSITSDMQSVSYPKKIIFRNAMSISYSDTYTETTFDPAENTGTTETEPFVYGTYYSNAVSRSIYDLFVTSSSAVAMANGEQVASASENDRFRLMTVSCEMRTTQESTYSTLQENSYVIACGSTEFATASYLQSAVYGNTDILLSILTVIGREPVPVGLELKPFSDYTIDSLTTSAATVWTVCLAVIPAAAALITGTVILVRRKYA